MALQLNPDYRTVRAVLNCSTQTVTATIVNANADANADYLIKNMRRLFEDNGPMLNCRGGTARLRLHPDVSRAASKTGGGDARAGESGVVSEVLFS